MYVDFFCLALDINGRKGRAQLWIQPVPIGSLHLMRLEMNLWVACEMHHGWWESTFRLEMSALFRNHEVSTLSVARVEHLGKMLPERLGERRLVFCGSA